MLVLPSMIQKPFPGDAKFDEMKDGEGKVSIEKVIKCNLKMSQKLTIYFFATSFPHCTP